MIGTGNEGYLVLISESVTTSGDSGGGGNCFNPLPSQTAADSRTARS